MGDGAEVVQQQQQHGAGKDDEDETDEMVMPDFEAAESLNRGMDKTTEVIDATLKDVSPRYKCCRIGVFAPARQWLLSMEFVVSSQYENDEGVMWAYIEIKAVGFLC